ncbi:gamma-interferon-inducible lysosomal thiol reductase-like [Uloborus diversus]|uniref:gamma-interferon-inducible lysosomal thiol reductase-like n=1 Tax=Uloborus diversus TaxID=327109 RepID=UPI0024098EAB|nr:gamma-interferon-inducible lysosomal thiol reductase-like [Uloborus diversus]
MGSFSLFYIISVTALLFQHSIAQYDNVYQQRYYMYRIPSNTYSPRTTLRRAYFPVTVDEDPLKLASTSSDGRYVPSADAKKVSLDVYYETDCPDSMRFITHQLYPMFQEMEDIVDIKLVPYGKASENFNEVTRKYDFRCHHGPSECYGNTIQSCVISMYPETKDHLGFINCMESYPRPSHNGHKCARRHSMDWRRIEKCATSDEGSRLLHENAQLTENLSPSLYFVPWIVVDKVFTSTTHRSALRDLKTVVCNAYRGSHPKCSNKY